MIDFLDSLYTNITDKNIFLTRIKFYSILRLTVRIIVNVLVPIYYIITKKSFQAKSTFNIKNDRRLIVSLTTFPRRINRVWIVIESLLRQTHKPDMILLWLSEEQFDSIDKLPKKLLQQQKRGLQIRFCNGDLRSHKKYYYTLKEYPEDFLITVDDDIIYHTTMIAELVALNEEHPTSICCHRANLIKIENGKILPYTQWKAVKNKVTPSYYIFQTSGGGTLYPPHSLHNEVHNDKVFEKYCFYADDVWLNIMSRLNNTTIAKTDYFSSYLPVINFGDVSLSKINNDNGENDKQIKAVRNYYIKKIGIDAFGTARVNILNQ